MPTDRKKPDNAQRANDFATKRDVVKAISNLTTGEFVKIHRRLVALETPWYRKLWNALTRRAA